MNTIKISYEIETSYKTNKMLSLSKHIKPLNRVIPDSVYGNFHLKKALGIIVNLLALLKKLLLESLYLFLCAWVPIHFFSPHNSALPISVNIIFFLSCVLGPLQESEIFKTTDIKYTCLKYMHINSKSYIVQNVMQRITIHSVLFIPLLYYFFVPLEMPTDQFAAFVFCIVGFKFIGESLHLIVFEKTKKVICQHWFFLFPLFVLSFLGAYAPFIFHQNPDTDKIILTAPFLILVGIFFVLSVLYISIGYRKYNTYSFLRAFSSQNLISQIVAQELNQPDSDYTFKNKKLFVNQNDKKYYHLNGIDFINAIFFSRYRKYFRKHLIIRIVAILIITIAGLLFYSNSFPYKDVFDLLPFIIICISLLSISDPFCRIFYFDCDRMFLTYSPFKNIETLKKNYRYRLKKICLFNFIIGFATFLALTLFSYCTGILNIKDTLFMFFAIILAYLFYAVYSVSTYFLFQPYATDFKLSLKSLAISTLTSPLYLTCFILYSQKLTCVFIEFGLVIIYLIVATLLLPRLSPKFMRVK
ncbi:MAG: hypothetical protein ACFWTN_11930 [Clostridium sp.]|jgi:hypothetical protein